MALVGFEDPYQDLVPVSAETTTKFVRNICQRDNAITMFDHIHIMALVVYYQQEILTGSVSESLYQNSSHRGTTFHFNSQMQNYKEVCVMCQEIRQSD